MKKISLLLAFVAVFATASFAKGSKKQIKINYFKLTSCTVKVVTGNYNVTITNTCDCTAKQACDGAYKIATILL